MGLFIRMRRLCLLGNGHISFKLDLEAFGWPRMVDGLMLLLVQLRLGRRRLRDVLDHGKLPEVLFRTCLFFSRPNILELLMAANGAAVSQVYGTVLDDV